MRGYNFPFISIIKTNNNFMSDVVCPLPFWRFTELHYSQTHCQIHTRCQIVLEIYRITLLSNNTMLNFFVLNVLEIYRITLLSNCCCCLNYTILSFGDLQNYTTLKLLKTQNFIGRRFGDLQNYTTLKLILSHAIKTFAFWRFTELHYSQTVLHNFNAIKGFWRFTELHYSQTIEVFQHRSSTFWRFTELHYSQTMAKSSA